MLDELLNESWAFQEILQKGLEKGLQEGLKQGQEEALKKALEASSRTLITLVEYRYPSLAQLAREKANLTLDLDALQNLILRVSLSTNEAEVHESLK
jgi:flagellar biosynthesis/type III secretory pathway protein FliH